MAFGTITVKMRGSQPMKKMPDIVAPPPAPVVKGTSEVRIAVAAPTLTEMEDLVCGIYFDLIEAAAPTSLSVYTREFQAVTRLADLKSELEAAARMPVGTPIRRVMEEGAADLGRCTITIGIPSGGAPAGCAAALDISFTHIVPGGAANAANAVFAMLNAGDPDMPKIKAAVERAAGNVPIYWIITGFEEMEYIFGGISAEPPKAAVKKALCKQAGIPRRENDRVAYAQIYGGIKLSGRSGNNAEFVSGSVRDYMPIGCHFPVIAAVDNVLRIGANSGNSADRAACSALKTGFAYPDTVLKSWCGQHPEDGGDKEE